jgi:hypothetical protein
VREGEGGGERKEDGEGRKEMNEGNKTRTREGWKLSLLSKTISGKVNTSNPRTVCLPPSKGDHLAI